jgi:hypothetical protein
MVGFSLSVPLSIEGGKTSSPEQLETEFIVTGCVMVAAVIGLVYFLQVYLTPAEGLTSAIAKGGADGGEAGVVVGLGTGLVARSNEKGGEGVATSNNHRDGTSPMRVHLSRTTSV